MKATEQYFPVVLFIMLCTVVLTFESVHVDEIRNCDHSNEIMYEGVLTRLLSLWMNNIEQYFPFHLVHCL